MPNWCMNDLTVSGDAEELKRFVFATQGLPAKYPPQEWEKSFPREEPKDPFFCFNALVPTPEAVLQIGYDGHNKLPKDALRYALTGRSFEPIDGYHWNIQNWGTKWDVYRDRLTPEDMGWQEGCDSISFSFDTAWTPPVFWFERMTEIFPTLYFKLHYEEPGCYFAGDLIYEDGNIIDDAYDDARCAQLFSWEKEGEDDLMVIPADYTGFEPDQHQAIG